jgi:hypothetical protein
MNDLKLFLEKPLELEDPWFINKAPRYLVWVALQIPDNPSSKRPAT